MAASACAVRLSSPQLAESNTAKVRTPYEREINTVLKSPEVASKLAAQGIEVRTVTAPAQAYIEGQIDV